MKTFSRIGKDGQEIQSLIAKLMKIYFWEDIVISQEKKYSKHMITYQNILNYRFNSVGILLMNGLVNMLLLN